ncbi:hypothetical protein BDV98DRAFT_562059 [Pterulicium gracile]|uniref:Ribosomal protein S6 n=1 Tax=Pterulicium gracile TaxID=1884261 RepID=A0A5C3QSK4_9AGAR|nr:hypothetical protein BDV98DRAFT_562059 [Pterula gracilis]
MTFYKMVCIAVHYPQFTHVKELVRQASVQVMQSGGVVRDIQSWGTLVLPQRMKRLGGKDQPYHAIGDYWTLSFAASPQNLKGLNNIMRRDPRVLRWTVLKEASTLEKMAKIEDKLE